MILSKNETYIIFIYKIIFNDIQSDGSNIPFGIKNQKALMIAKLIIFKSLQVLY